MPAGAGVLTIEFKINLLAPARGPLLHFEGRVTKAGRTISVVDGHAYQFAPGGGERKLVATMTATVMTVTGRDDVRH
jgi:acyl-coenzyme A thioesterase PaaI-like protein